MNPRLRLLVSAAAVAFVLGLAACGGDATGPNDGGQPEDSAPATDGAGQDENGDDRLYDEITRADYGSWQPAPGYDTRQPATGPHGDETQIFLGPSAEKALADGASEWPVGAIIVKDVYQDGRHTQIAAMKKTQEGWYWGEYDTNGKPIVEGLRAEPCESCHAKGTDGTLAVKLD